MVEKIDNYNFYIIVTIFILSFTKGVLSIVGVSETVSQLTIETLIVILFFKSILYIIREKGEFKGVGIVTVLLLLTIIFISFLLSTVSKIQLIFFIKKFVIYYMFFYAIFNIYLIDEHKNKIKNLIIFLFFLQLIATIVKLFLIGTSEDFIGTMSVSEGSVATVMPLFALSYLLSNYILDKKNIYLILSVLFISIGLMSNKMGILYYSIFLYLYIIFIYSGLNTIFLKNLLVSLLFSSLVFSAYLSLNPRANPEHVVGGSIDIEYLYEYSLRYQTRETTKGVKGDGRFEAPFVAFEKMQEGGLLNVLVGFGPGELVKSSFLKYKKPLFEKYHIGYGGRIAIVWIMMQIGIIGLLLVVVFHSLLLIQIKHIYKYKILNKEHKMLLISFIGISAVYFVDIFTYSSAVIDNTALALVYFYSFFYIYGYKEEINSEQ